MSNLTNKAIVILALLAMLCSLSVSALADNTSFKASLNIIDTLLKVTKVKDLQFDDAVLGQQARLVTAPTSPNAAIFSAIGIPNARVTASVVENTINMITGSGQTNQEQVVVRNFKMGGSVNRRGRARFDAAGQLQDIRVGAVARVKANNVAGSYEGTATFMIVYQ